MKVLQIFATIIIALFLFPFLSYSESCDGFRDPSVLNLLTYNVGLSSKLSPQNKLIQIKKGQKQSCIGNYKRFYIERYFKGADPWEFNLCDLQISDDQSILFVLTKEGLFVLKNINNQDVLKLDQDVIRNKAIKRLLPLD